jgi:hypothetical protein
MIDGFVQVRRFSQAKEVRLGGVVVGHDDRSGVKNGDSMKQVPACPETKEKTNGSGVPNDVGCTMIEILFTGRMMALMMMNSRRPMSNFFGTFCFKNCLEVSYAFMYLCSLHDPVRRTM